MADSLSNRLPALRHITSPPPQLARAKAGPARAPLQIVARFAIPIGPLNLTAGVICPNPALDL